MVLLDRARLALSAGIGVIAIIGTAEKIAGLHVPQDIKGLSAAIAIPVAFALLTMFKIN